MFIKIINSDGNYLHIRMNIVSSNTINSIKVEQVQFNKIRKIEGSQMIATDYPAYLVDESKLEGIADWLFFPNSEIEVVSIVNFLTTQK